tara:strand:- start:1710 stop:2447 length:738 start_codon:yes stop_codon:yes gene_type:complete
MTKLRKDGINYFINRKTSFSGVQIDEKSILKSLDFSLRMSYGTGFHREYRSGGTVNRNVLDIFSNTFQGKLSEFCVIDFFCKNGLNISNPVDLNVYGKGVWDTSDLIYKSKKINIKSCSYLLLLEKNDWNLKGHYIPNLSSSFYEYDYFVLVRIKDDVKSMFKEINKLKSKELIIDSIRKIVCNSKFYYDIPGYFTTKTLIHIIDKKYLLPKNSLLNGKIKMDASNYYIQSGDLKHIDFLINELK